MDGNNHNNEHNKYKHLSIDGSIIISPTMRSLGSSLRSMGTDRTDNTCHSHTTLSISGHSPLSVAESTISLSNSISLELLDELSERRKDIEAIQMLHDNDMDIPREEFENIKQSTIRRHRKHNKMEMKGKFDNIIQSIHDRHKYDEYDVNDSEQMPALPLMMRYVLCTMYYVQ